MTERDLRKKMAKQVRDAGGWCAVIHGGPQQGAGLPDIIGAYMGVCLGLEVKLPGKEKNLTKRQAHTLRSMREAGAEAHMVTTRQQVAEILEGIRERQQNVDVYSH